jgi:hypothetical protein
MAAFSLNDAWNEGVAFVRNNLQTVAIWAAIGAVIPALLQLVILGGVAGQQALMQQMIAGGEAGAALTAAGGGLIVVAIISQIVTFGSYFGAWRMGLAREAVAPPQAATYALGASLLSLLLMIAVILILAIALVIPLGVLGAFGAERGSTGGGVGLLAGIGIALLLFLLIIPLFLWLSARLAVFGPVMAEAGSINPLFGFAQSWRMTRDSQWAILGYLVLLFIALIVLGLIIGLISGVGMMATGGLSTTGQIGTGSLIFSTVLGLIFAVPLAMVYIAVPAGIYRALQPDTTSDVFS